MPDMVSIAEMTHDTVLVERIGAAARPSWIEASGRPLANAARNPFLQ